MRWFALLVAAAAACSTDDCHSATASVADVCVPAALASNQQGLLEARESCGPACSSPPDCSATLENGAVTLHVSQDVCVILAGSACSPQPCQQRTILCKLPGLAPGDYPLLAPGAPDRVLHVADPGAARCNL